jgi:hypothetical protein
MQHWQDFQTGTPLRKLFREIAAKIRSGKLDLGRYHYAQSVTLSVLQAIYCGYERLALVEFGVAAGAGLLDLCKAAQFFRDELGMDIAVYGFDNATGLPPPADYRDHPEMWGAAQFKMPDPAILRAKLPDFAELVIGDIKDTIGGAEAKLDGARIGFVSIDVDYYSSTIAAMQFFKLAPQNYLPAPIVYFDDILHSLLYNKWCGEELAIEEFNKENQFRKLQENRNFRIRHFHVLHVLDHPIRNGLERHRTGFPLIINPLI